MKWLILVFCVSSLLACSKLEDPPSENELIGSWEWIRTEDPTAEDYQKVYLTPENTFRSINHAYGTDGLVSIIENDTLISKAYFQIEGDHVVSHIYEDTTFVFDFKINGEFLKLIRHPDMIIEETYTRSSTR